MLKHLRLVQCDSTQDELKRHFEVYSLVSAEVQNQGRGRGNHSWEHRPGALAFSFSAPAHPQLTWQALEVAVSLAESIESLWSVRVTLKWPNDIYLHGKKCGGILLQHQNPYMFIGVGLNVNPVSDSPWGSVLTAPIDWKTQLYHEIPEQLVSSYLLNHPRPLAQLQQAWSERCAHLGRMVTITDGEEKTTGLFQGLGQHGEAIVNGKLVFNGTLRWD
jgi:BirA family transcriptional regulator, biotin operon repressor / biotin---[acetyl-CoA-carboxylase] ligase